MNDSLVILDLFTIVTSVIFSSHWVMGDKASIIIVALPQTKSSTPLSWERGEDILPGALVAKGNINDDSRLNVSLRLLIADSGLVSSTGYSFSGNILEVIANLTIQGGLNDVIGITGVLHPGLLVALKLFQLPTVSLVNFGETKNHTNAYYATASTSVVADSLLAVMKYLKKNTLGLITETNHSYYSRLSSQLRKVSNLVSYIEVNNQSSKHSLSRIINGVSRSKVNVFVLGASGSFALKVLCIAHKVGLSWPAYAWILVSFQSSAESLLTDEGCWTQDILEGVIILNLAQVKSLQTCTVFGGNPFAYVLHDAIWKLVLAAKAGDYYSQLTNSQLLDFGPSKVYLYQISNLSLNPSAVYESESKRLVNVTIGTLTNSRHEFSASLPLPYLMILPTLCCIFNTVLLVLFFCFRKEPDVKSTAVSLSFLMFTGCYIYAAYAITIIVDEYFTLSLCMLRISGLSLCIPLVLATVLVKMLRVYHVFRIRGYERPSIFLYNCALFVYALLIITPKVCIVILWSAVDIYRRKDIHIVDSSGFTVVQTQCHSNHTIVWSTLSAVYDVALSVAIVAVAYRTRKIRFARYKDTKKVNFMVFLVLLVAISAWLYWYVFTASGLYHPAPTYIAYTAAITIPFICQFTLFVPKVWTPLQKALKYR